MINAKINILHVSPDFNYSCGVSKYVFDILRYYKDSRRFNTFFLTNGGDALEKLVNENINYRKVDFQKGAKNIVRLLKDYVEFKRIVSENKIDIIHTHHRYPELISFLIAKSANVKTVTTAHSFVNGFYYLSFKSDKIIAVSNAIKNYIVENYPVSPERIITSYNFLDYKIGDAENFVRKKFGVGKNSFVFLFAGRINKIKGIDLLIEAFRKIIADGIDAYLFVIGTEFDETYERLDIESDEKIIRVDAVEDLSPFYQESDAVVLPSREDPFPFVMLEAGYFSKIFIGAKVGGIAEFIEDEKNGLLFKKENGKELYEKMKKTVLRKDELKSLGKNLHNKVKELTDKENYFSKLEQIYMSLLND